MPTASVRTARRSIQAILDSIGEDQPNDAKKSKVETHLIAMASNLLVMASTLVAMASNLIAMASRTQFTRPTLRALLKESLTASLFFFAAPAKNCFRVSSKMLIDNTTPCNLLPLLRIPPIGFWKVSICFMCLVPDDLLLLVPQNEQEVGLGFVISRELTC